MMSADQRVADTIEGYQQPRHWIKLPMQACSNVIYLTLLYAIARTLMQSEGEAQSQLSIVWWVVYSRSGRRWSEEYAR